MHHSPSASGCLLFTPNRQRWPALYQEASGSFARSCHCQSRILLACSFKLPSTPNLERASSHALYISACVGGSSRRDRYKTQTSQTAEKLASGLRPFVGMATPWRQGWQILLIPPRYIFEKERGKTPTAAAFSFPNLRHSGLPWKPR